MHDVGAWSDVGVPLAAAERYTYSDLNDELR
jgi:hypothetical protein